MTKTDTSLHVKMSREWSMPNAKTFDMPPVACFLNTWLHGAKVIVDPFAGGSTFATYRNDLNPDAPTMHHREAGIFCAELLDDPTFHGADAVLFDPPYSPRQISECYKRIGLKVGMLETQNARLYKRVRDGLDLLLKPGGIALSFGWNSAGFGKERGYDLLEVLLVAHGGAHNDTICVAERKVARP